MLSSTFSTKLHERETLQMSALHSLISLHQESFPFVFVSGTQFPLVPPRLNRAFPKTRTRRYAWQKYGTNEKLVHFIIHDTQTLYHSKEKH